MYERRERGRERKNVTQKQEITRSTMEENLRVSTKKRKLPEEPVYNEVILGLQSLRQARMSVAGLEPAIEGSPQTLKADSLATVPPTPP
ncbi:hypothetical protein PoB_001216300 [Plakobranchus ocellatus]|uniref:Uncharacterized protein n=1 Tax=Plakobranchus ocellatus TaxID=259542 RepID=A0AAV3YTT5_9GAST|nr:hypothetical protein PoB_001216300 [Plakobranchus ocellatus]